jgi:uncharacterized protein YfiM (DUF2279 family)
MTELIRIAVLLAMLSGAHDAQVAAVPARAMTDIMDGSAVVRPVPLMGSDTIAVASVRPDVVDAWLGSDKFQHFGMSYAVTAFTFAALRTAGADAGPALTSALPVAAAAGVGKEVYDRRRGQIFSLRDLVADGLGIAAAYFFLREVR